MERSPILIESGTKYFLQETLKQCNKVRNYYYSFLLNIFILFIFLLALGGILYYRYTSKLSPEEKKKKSQTEQEYILTTLVLNIIRDINLINKPLNYTNMSFLCCYHSF